MPNYKRYEVCSPWLLDNAELEYRGTIVVVEVADLKDKRNGDVFRDGAWRVRLVDRDGATKYGKTKTWFGETAHNDAIRYANDAYNALRLGREVPAR